jgi:ribosome-associated translation inhibitor RaiA
MKTEIRFRGLESSESLRDHTMRQIHLHLSRFGRELSAVAVRIGDTNGPKGGVDKQCRITVRGPRFGSSTLDEFSSDTYSAVDLAVERMARTAGRALERARDVKHGGTSVRRAS